MSNTPNNNIPYVPENVIDPAAGLNLSLDKIDGLLQLSVIAEQQLPAAAAADGDRYLVAPGATGEWAGQDGKIARWVTPGDYWQFYDAYMLVNQQTGCLMLNIAGVWSAAACVSS